MRKIALIAAAASLASVANVVDVSSEREPGNRKHGKDKPFKRDPHHATIAKPKSDSLKRLLGKAKVRP